MVPRAQGRRFRRFFLPEPRSARCAPLQIVSDKPERRMACERRQSSVAVGTEGRRASQEGKRLEGDIVRPYPRRAAALDWPELRPHRPGGPGCHQGTSSASRAGLVVIGGGASPREETPSARVNEAPGGHQVTTVAVALWPIHGNAYAITLDEEVIVIRSRAPARDAARELQRRGFSGPFETIDCQTGQTRMRFPDIARAAR